MFSLCADIAYKPRKIPAL